VLRLEPMQRRPGMSVGEAAFFEAATGLLGQQGRVTTGPGGISWKGQCFFFTLTREVQVFMVSHRPGAVA